MSTVETARGPADTAPTTRTAVLIDFGGVITTSVLRAFEQFGELLGAPPVLGLLSHDTAARELMVEHECGRIDADAFDRGFAYRLSAYGVVVQPEGLSARMQAGLRRDDDTVRADRGPAGGRSSDCLGIQRLRARLLCGLRSRRARRHGGDLFGGRHPQAVAEDLRHRVPAARHRPAPGRHG